MGIGPTAPNQVIDIMLHGSFLTFVRAGGPRIHFFLAFIGILLTPLLIPLAPRQSALFVGYPMLVFWAFRPRISTIDVRNFCFAAWAVCLLGVWAGASWLWADDPSIAANWGWRIAGLLLIAVLTNPAVTDYPLHKMQPAFRALLVVWPLAILALIVLTAAQRGWIDMAVNIFTDRSLIVLNNSMQAMALMVFTTPIAAKLAGLRVGTSASLGLIAIGFGLSLIYGDSQAGSLGILAGSVVLVLTLWRPVFGLVALIALLVAVVVMPVAITMWLYPDGVPTLLEVLPRSFVHRLEIWSLTIEAIGQRPWLGWGLEASRSLVIDDRSTLLFQDVAKIPLHPHNAFLQIQLDLGVIGSALAIVTIGLILRFLWAAPRLTRASGFAAMAGAGTVYGFAVGVWQEWWIILLFFVAAMLRGCAHWERQASSGSEASSVAKP